MQEGRQHTHLHFFAEEERAVEDRVARKAEQVVHLEVVGQSFHALPGVVFEDLRPKRDTPAGEVEPVHACKVRGRVCLCDVRVRLESTHQPAQLETH